MVQKRSCGAHVSWPDPTDHLFGRFEAVVVDDAGHFELREQQLVEVLVGGASNGDNPQMHNRRFRRLGPGERCGVNMEQQQRPARKLLRLVVPFSHGIGEVVALHSASRNPSLWDELDDLGSTLVEGRDDVFAVSPWSIAVILEAHHQGTTSVAARVGILALRRIFQYQLLPELPAECVDLAPMDKDVPGLVFAPAAPAPPTAETRDLPEADDTHLNSCLDLGASYIQANAGRFAGGRPMAPWESADLFMEADQAVSEATTLPRTQEEDIYERALHNDDDNPRRPWETAALICNDSHCIRGCIIADWSAPPDEPSSSNTILQSELVAGTVLLLRLLFLDYWPLAQSFIIDNKLEIRLTTFTRSSIRAVNV
ncbi:hypothetical protein B0T14DRAFT_597142 [Immersiella caudata]|uniref:Uncharacterized protein n=1 Tax=Immersiella caudata TaxID=314043 RepID=A0AA39XCN7_9PEZI|nr:hypothetical protein B0T14DRAFT_597142 [Immersiella caudata]